VPLFAVYDVGVADGVGGWRTYGVDPSQFPKSLMAACERMVHSGQFTPRRPVDVLSSGYSEIQQDKAPLIGIITAAECNRVLSSLPFIVCSVRLLLCWDFLLSFCLPNTFYFTSVICIFHIFKLVV